MNQHDPVYRVLRDHLELIIDEAGNFDPPDHVLDLVAEVIRETEGAHFIHSDIINGDTLAEEYSAKFLITGKPHYAMLWRTRCQHLFRDFARLEAEDARDDLMRIWRMDQPGSTIYDCIGQGRDAEHILADNRERARDINAELRRLGR